MKKQEKHEEAFDAFSEAVVIAPDFAIAWYNLGQLERRLNHFDLAKTYLDKAILLQSNLTKAYFERAMLHKQMGDKEIYPSYWLYRWTEICFSKRIVRKETFRIS